METPRKEFGNIYSYSSHLNRLLEYYYLGGLTSKQKTLWVRTAIAAVMEMDASPLPAHDRYAQKQNVAYVTLDNSCRKGKVFTIWIC